MKVVTLKYVSSVTPCCLVECCQRFARIRCLHIQDRRETRTLKEYYVCMKVKGEAGKIYTRLHGVTLVLTFAEISGVWVIVLPCQAA